VSKKHPQMDASHSDKRQRIEAEIADGLDEELELEMDDARLAKLVAAAGLDHPAQLRLEHFMRRQGADKFATYAELYAQTAPGELVQGPIRDPRLRAWWAMARAESFAPAEPSAVTERRATA